MKMDFANIHPLVFKVGISYKYFILYRPEVSGMKMRWLLTGLLCLAVLWVLKPFAVHAQGAPKSLTLLYSNNFNAEIEPCPT
jgi:hypothetical protein